MGRSSERPAARVSFLLDQDLNQEVERLMRQVPRRDKTMILNSLIAEGLRASDELERSRRREELLLMKLLFMMRYLVSSRPGELLEEIDRRFSDELPAIKDLIFEEGMDYVGR
jgi:hypothetical protein